MDARGQSPFLILLLTFVSSGLVLALISLPLIFEKVKPNPFYGFRVRATLEDPAIWYAVNKYAGVRLFWVGVIITITSLVLSWLPGLQLDSYALICALVFVGLTMVVIMQSFRYLSSITKASPGPGSTE